MEKPPIPRNVSGVAYITTAGTIGYFTSGPGIEKPANFKELAPFSNRRDPDNS